MTMRPLQLIFLAFLLAASRLLSAQTLDDATRSLEKKEYEKARAILEKLSAQGITEAEVRLAEMYVVPIGIPRNAQRAIALYESAAQKRNPEAQFILGTELIKGGLITPDKNRGMALLSTSAKQKYAAAQIFLCMELSTDDSKYYNAEEAYAWCETASKKDHKQAGEAGRRAKETLRKLQEKQGDSAVQAAKARAARYATAY